MKQLSLWMFTSAHLSGLILRITFAGIVLPHGLKMAFGWFGGSGFKGTMEYLTKVEGLSRELGLLVVLLQVICPIAILTGTAVRPVALVMAFIFTGMIVNSHWKHGFFMNWSGSNAGEGFEYHLLVIGICMALVAEGAGRFSIDGWLTRAR